MRFTNILVAGLMAATFATTATAAIAYNNGAPNAVSGNETVAWVQAEDFTLSSNTTLTGAGVYLAGFGGIGAWDGSFQYYLFSASGGTPGTILQQGSVSITPSDSGTAWCCGGNAQLFSFNFASAFAATGGTTYFLGIHAGAPGNFNRDEIYWVSTAYNATAAGVESSGGTFDNWSGNGTEHAFYLNAVPEPASWAMMITGFGLVGAAMRRRTTLLAA